MKIDEPDTPFNGEYVPSDDDEEQEHEQQQQGAAADTEQQQTQDAKDGDAKRTSVDKKVDLSSQMGDLEKELARNPKSRWDTTDSPDDADKKRKHKEFMQKRAQHYNMGEQMRRARLAIQKELEEEEAREAAKAAKASANAQ